ncbi:MAG: hypothetical protein U0531_08480 [Dehalococcoidia bacterium]
MSLPGPYIERRIPDDADLSVVAALSTFVYFNRFRAPPYPSIAWDADGDAILACALGGSAGYIVSSDMTCWRWTATLAPCASSRRRRSSPSCTSAGRRDRHGDGLAATRAQQAAVEGVIARARRGGAGRASP